MDRLALEKAEGRGEGIVVEAGVEEEMASGGQAWVIQPSQLLSHLLLLSRPLSIPQQRPILQHQSLKSEVVPIHRAGKLKSNLHVSSAAIISRCALIIGGCALQFAGLSI